MADSAKLEPKPDGFEIVTSYQYEPLPTRQHTRVLVLEPGPNYENQNLLVGSLQLLDLCDANSEPFEAISYVWGSPARTHVILVNGRPLSIPDSLRDALLQTRLPDRSRTLWADAICINQSDHKEKGHQVATMGRIYKTSKRTLICLGTQDPGCAHDAAGLIDEVQLMIESVQKDRNFSGEAGSFPYSSGVDTIPCDVRWQCGWNTMVRQPWFGRGWVVQEASFGPDACVLWASVQIAWTSILRVNYWLMFRGQFAHRPRDGEHLCCLSIHHLCSFTRRHPKEARLFYKNAQVTDSLSTLTTLFEARRFELSDPRDRIYAFMALDTSDGIMADLQMEPDYKRSYFEIYHDFAVKYIEKTRNLDILSFIKHTEESLASTASPHISATRWAIPSWAIPSWVPRWNLERFLISPSRTNLGNYPKVFKFSEQGHVLRVRGLILGSVEYTARQEPYCQRSRASLAFDHVVSLWREIVAASRADERPYNERQAFAFLDVLCPLPQISTFERWSTPRKDFAELLQSYIKAPRDSQHENSPTMSKVNERVRPKPFDKENIQTKELPQFLHPNSLVTGPYYQHGTRATILTLAEEIRCRGRRRFVILSRGYYGIAPPITRKGDLVALIYGSETFSILRPAESRPGHYKVVGPVYVESKMVLNPHGSNMMGKEGCRDWEKWGLLERYIRLC